MKQKTQYKYRSLIPRDEVQAEIARLKDQIKVNKGLLKCFKFFGKAINTAETVKGLEKMIQVDQETIKMHTENLSR